MEDAYIYSVRSHTSFFSTTTLKIANTFDFALILTRMYVHFGCNSVRAGIYFMTCVP